MSKSSVRKDEEKGNTDMRAYVNDIAEDDDDDDDDEGGNDFDAGKKRKSFSRA